MRLLLFGAGGLLGRHLASALPQRGHDVAALAHHEADITDAGTLDGLFREQWDAVINAAAVCDFDRCENDPVSTGRINLDAPLDLARRCDVQGATFVQFSSDYIFGGAIRRALSEDDQAAPLSVYGEQKAALERDIPRLCPRSLVLRLSWLYGSGGRTFMSLMPAMLASHPRLQVASGKTGCCLYAPDAADWIGRLLESSHTGLFNLANAGETSWEAFAHACLAEMAAAGLDPACREIIEVPYTQMGPNWVKRPRHSSLDVEKLRRHLPPGPRPWREALADFIRAENSFAAPAAL